MRRLLAIVTLALLIASCSAIDDIEDDLSTVTLPDVTLPDVTLPDLTLPDLTLPDVTLPDVTLPDVTVPDVSIPDVTLPGPTTTMAELTTTTTTTAEPVTTAEQTTTTTTTATTTPTTAPTPSSTTVVGTTVTAPTTTAVSPSTSLVEEDEGGISPWWLLAILAVVGGVGFAVWRNRVEAARLAEQRERLRVAYLQGRWMEDQFDDRLVEERRSEPDPRGLRVALEPVLADIRRLEADSSDAAARAAVKELGDSMRGLDRAIDGAAGLTTAISGEFAVPDARARLAAASEAVASLSNGDLPPRAGTG